MDGAERLPGIGPGDWFSVTCDFSPPEIAEAKGHALASRTLIAEDAGLGGAGFLLWQVLDNEPDALGLAELLPFLDYVVGKVGRPRLGWVINHSCWESSVELAVDDVNWVHGEMLEREGICFGPMSGKTRAGLGEWARSQGLFLLFDADDLGEFVD